MSFLGFCLFVCFHFKTFGARQEKFGKHIPRKPSKPPYTIHLTIQFNSAVGMDEHRKYHALLVPGCTQDHWGPTEVFGQWYQEERQVVTAGCAHTAPGYLHAHSGRGEAKRWRRGVIEGLYREEKVHHLQGSTDLTADAWWKRLLQVWAMFTVEKGMATQCSILAWEIPWTQESSRLQYSSWSCKESDTKESDMTECTHTHTALIPIEMVMSTFIRQSVIRIYYFLPFLLSLKHI